jgi:hypothetical protein
MPLAVRILNIIFEMHDGTKVVLDHTLHFSAKIHKDALAPQNTCTISIYNLTKTRREQLLSQFTAWNRRIVNTTNVVAAGQNKYINVTVEAGYVSGGKNTTAVVFVGQVVEVTMASAPPDLGIRIECYTRQLDKTNRRTNRPPPQATFLEYAQWVGRQMDVPVVCETKVNDSKDWRHSVGTQWVSNLIIDLQDSYKPNVVAFFENGTLIVRDLDRVITTAEIVDVEEFIGTPMYTEYGMQFKALFNPRITLVSAVRLKSLMNPSLNGQYILQSIDYELASREVPFYVSGSGSPPASQVGE